MPPSIRNLYGGSRRFRHHHPRCLQHHLYLHSLESSGHQHRLHRHYHHRRQRSVRQCPGQQLRLEFHHRRQRMQPAAHRALRHSAQRFHRRLLQLRRHRHLQRGHERCLHQLSNLYRRSRRHRHHHPRCFQHRLYLHSLEPSGHQHRLHRHHHHRRPEICSATPWPATSFGVSPPPPTDATRRPPCSPSPRPMVRSVCVPI